jgi:molecular chaperone DnaK
MSEAEEDLLKDKLIIGIDLGTTKSGVSVWDEKLGRVVMLPDEQGRELTPSVVGWNRAEQRWSVGHDALTLLEEHPGDAVYSIKRYIGRWFNDPEVIKGYRRMAYNLRSGGGMDQLLDIVVDFGTSDTSPPPQTAPEISSKILSKLRGDAARALNLPLSDVKYAVITVPAYFNVLQRRATILAGQMAGLEVVDILNEPTAAALSYKSVLDEREKRILVYDLGGGTFDISLLEARSDAVGYQFFTLIVDGDTRLGGDDIDARVVEWLKGQIQERYHRTVRPDDAVTNAKLRMAAEHAKVELSRKDSTTINLPNLDLGSRSPFDAQIELTADQLKECAGEVIARAREITERAVRQIAELEWEQLDEVLLVGGQTLMPAIQKDIEELTGSKPHASEKPQHAIALGAGEYAHILSLGEDRFHENTLSNVIALPLGIRENVNDFVPLIDANVTVPSKGRSYYATNPEDNQTSIRVEVLQGPRGATKAEQCVPLGFLDMDVLPRPARTHKFEIVLDVRSDGTMKVIITDKHTNQTQTKDIIETKLVQFGQKQTQKENQ